MKNYIDLLKEPLSAHETRWAGEIADKMPDNDDLTFDEAKILTRLPVSEWPEELLARVRGVINIEDFEVDDNG